MWQHLQGCRRCPRIESEIRRFEIRIEGNAGALKETETQINALQKELGQRQAAILKAERDKEPQG